MDRIITPQVLRQAADELTMENWGQGAMMGTQRGNIISSNQITAFTFDPDEAKFFCAFGMCFKVADYRIDPESEDNDSYYNILRAEFGPGTWIHNDGQPFTPDGLANVKEYLHNVADELEGELHGPH